MVLLPKARFSGIQQMRSWGYAPSFSAQVRWGEGHPSYSFITSDESGVRGESRGIPHPGFPVRLVGVDERHAAFLDESRTRGRCLMPRTGNPGISRKTSEMWGTRRSLEVEGPSFVRGPGPVVRIDFGGKNIGARCVSRANAKETGVSLWRGRSDPGSSLCSTQPQSPSQTSPSSR